MWPPFSIVYRRISEPFRQRLERVRFTRVPSYGSTSGSAVVSAGPRQSEYVPHWSKASRAPCSVSWPRYGTRMSAVPWNSANGIGCVGRQRATIASRKVAAIEAPPAMREDSSQATRSAMKPPFE